MNRPLVFMFSGQGSQYFQMGQQLYQQHARFRLWMDHCNEIVSPLINTSLLDVMYHRGHKSMAFDRVLYTTPALIAVQYSLAQVFIEHAIRPDYLLGYSLGEFTAAMLGGAMELEQGLQLTVEFARRIEEKVPPARMLAVIDSVTLMAEHPEVFADCELTGSNFNRNFVVSASPSRIAALQAWLKTQEKHCELLPINYGFHTADMAFVASDLRQLATYASIHPLNIPMISCVSGQIITTVDADYIWDVVRKPVVFQQAIERLIQTCEPICLDLSPTGTLATFVKYIKPPNSGLVCYESMNKFGRDVESLEKVLQQLNLCRNMKKVS